MDISARQAGHGLLRRRNGRPQACEPCRKRKVACDHAYPICRRCVSRNTAGQCNYLVSSSLRTGLKNSPARSSISNHNSDHLKNADQTFEVPGQIDVARELSETSPGYLGYTSFSAVYQETQSSLSIVDNSNGLVTTHARAHTGARHVEDLSPATLEKCLYILQHLPDPDAAFSLISQNINPNEGWIRLAGRRLCESLYTNFEAQIDSRDTAALQDMAGLISRNTADPWVEDEPDAGSWISSISGPNIRWECIGMLFTYWFYGANTTETRRPDLPSTGNLSMTASQKQALGYKEAAERCMKLCERYTPNSLQLCLLFNLFIINGIICGDTSRAVSKRHGELIGLAMYLGLHAITPSSSYTPAASSEARRILIAQIFKIDKVIASFCGRPPLLSRKYVLTPLPLDLSDDVLLSDAETVAKATSSLDEKGWNTDGKIYSTTILRARTLLAENKGMIMEIALSLPECSSIEDLLKLKAREYDTMSTLPSIIKYTPTDVRDASIDKSTLYAKIFVHLEHLQNLFFVLRLLVQREHSTSHAELVSLSFEMVVVTLVFWTHMDRLAGLHGDVESLVMAYAAPAGGVLCNALLMPSLQIEPESGITRSRIIQQLSLLVGFLDWVSPSAPNGDLCGSCKAIIERVLDHSLNLPVDSATLGVDMYGFSINPTMNLNGHFNFDLLDTYDFLRPEVSSSQQPSQL